MTNLVDQFTNLHPVAKFALISVVVVQGAALLAWSCWVVAEVRQDSVRAMERKNK